MKTLKLFLTVPQSAAPGEIQINIDNYTFYSSKLPWFEDQKKWRTTMIKALGANQFDESLFSDDEETNWMVNQGWLTNTKTHFTSDILKKIGQDIYQTLFPSEKAKSLLSKIVGTLKTNEQLHIQIQFSEKVEQRGRLPDYPWELVCDERGFLAKRQVTFSRLIAFQEDVPDLPPVEQINLLLVSSTVGDSDPEIKLSNLDFEEQKAILKSLQTVEGKDIIVDQKSNISFKELGDYLTKIDSKKAPHIIHFDGHGFFGKRCHQSGCRTIHKRLRATHCRKCNSPLEEHPQGYLLFESDDQDREVDYISATEINDLIKKTNLDLEDKPELGVRLIVMSACKSGMALGSESVFNGIAQQLIAQQIPAVVAMQYNIAVDAATNFAERFYQALANKKPLTTAVSSGQAAMSREGNQWYRPVLYLRWDKNDGGQLFAETEPITPALERYANNLVTELEGNKGVLEYVDLFAQTATSLNNVVSNPQSHLAPGLDILASSHKSNAENEKDITELKIDNIVANNQKLILVGESGTGKSTVLKHIALNQAKKFLSDPITLPMPFVLELAFWSKDISFISFLNQQWQDFQLPSIKFQDLFTEGKVTLYLDSLDAISADVNRVNQIRTWLRSSQAPKQVIITCRSDDYLDNDINLGLPTFQIQPMSTEQIRIFVSRELKDESDNFLEQILPNVENKDTKHSLQQLASNPYLLYALIIIYQYEPNNKLPQNSGALFSRLVKALWKRERQKFTTKLLPYSEIETYFAGLANYMFQEDTLIIKRETAISILNNDRDLLLAGQSANLLVIKGDIVRFFNQLIENYFVAVTLKNKDLSSIIKKPNIFNGKRLRERWDYPLVALCGLVDEPDEIVRQIAEKDPYLAAMCLNSGVKVNNETLEFIVSKLVQTFDITIKDNLEEIIQYEKIGDTKKQLAQYHLNKLGEDGKDVVPILANKLIDPQQNVFIKSAILELLDIYNDVRIIQYLSILIQYPSIEEKAIKLADQQLTNNKLLLTASSVLNLAAVTISKKTSKGLSITKDIWKKAWGVDSPSSKLELRVQAINVLGRLRDKEATLPLIEGLIDSNNDVRQACLTTLQSLNWQPKTEKERLYLLIAENRWADCQAFGELAISPLLSVLNYQIEAAQINIIITLGELGLKAKAAVVPIITKLFDDNASIKLKQSCIEAISLIPTEVSVVGLLKASLVFSEDLQSLAIEKLNNIDEKQKVAGLTYAIEVYFDTIIQTKSNPTIGKLFKGDENTKLKIAAIKILGETGSPDAINVLLSTMNQDNEKLVIACINTLSDYKQPIVISAIVEKLKSEKNSIKKEAIKSLGKLQASTAVNELVKLLPQQKKKKLFGLNIPNIPFSETNLVDDILDALQQIGTTEARQAIDRWHNERKNTL